MLTPAFDISQNEDFLELIIKAPYTKISEAEVYIEECEVKFYAKPYYLRLNLPGPVVEDHRAVADYDSSQGVFTIKLPKVNPGQQFEGLDLLTQLLSPAKKPFKATTPVIEVISTDDQEGSLLNENEDEEFDWLIEQIPYSEPDISVDGPKYGFANQKSGVFKRLQAELHDIIDLPDADNTRWSERAGLREQDEDRHFDEDHYMADFCENDYLEDILSFTPEWGSEVENPDRVSFSDDEKEKMRKLPRKEYLLDEDRYRESLLSLVDIIFAYAYNHRTTEAENTVESAWTVRKLSSTLSWLEVHTNLKDTVRCSLRRCLTFPLHRSWRLAMKVLSDVQDIFTVGQKRILKCLLEVHSLLNESDPRYVLNDLYITDFCVWIQTVSPKEFKSMAKHLKEIKITKEEMGFDLDLIENACSLAQDEPLEEVSSALSSLTVTESEEVKTDAREWDGIVPEQNVNTVSEQMRTILDLNRSMGQREDCSDSETLTGSEGDEWESETDESQSESEEEKSESDESQSESEEKKSESDKDKTIDQKCENCDKKAQNDVQSGLTGAVDSTSGDMNQMVSRGEEIDDKPESSGLSGCVLEVRGKKELTAKCNGNSMTDSNTLKF